MPPTEDWKELSFPFSPFLPLSLCVWESGGKKGKKVLSHTHTLFPEKEEKKLLELLLSLARGILISRLVWQRRGLLTPSFPPENGREKVVGEALK